MKERSLFKLLLRRTLGSGRKINEEVSNSESSLHMAGYGSGLMWYQSIGQGGGDLRGSGRAVLLQSGNVPSCGGMLRVSD